MNYENIVVRLKNGETMEAIAKEMEDALNKANAEFKANQEKESKETKLNELAETIAAAATEYLRLVRPNLVKEDITGAELREALDEMLPLLDLFGDLKVSIKTKTVPTTSKREGSKTAEDVFADFFKSMNI